MRQRGILPDDGLARDLMLAATRVDVSNASSPSAETHPQPCPEPYPRL